MAKDGNGGLKILKGLECLVHAREAEIGDFVQLLQRAKDGEAHFMGVDFRSAGRADRFLDLLRQHGKVVFGHRPALACFPHPVDHFAAAERVADAAGLAEARYGAGEGVSGTVLVITLGTGIGSAFIFNGKLVPNAELGHLEIDGYDAESKASAVARERDGLSWTEYSVLLQRYFSHVEFLFSPELFIVGGGISKRADEYLPHMKLRTKIVPAELKNDAGIVGAALEIALKHRLAK
jgi:hypothetical protein